MANKNKVTVTTETRTALLNEIAAKLNVERPDDIDDLEFARTLHSAVNQRLAKCTEEIQELAELHRDIGHKLTSEHWTVIRYHHHCKDTHDG